MNDTIKVKNGYVYVYFDEGWFSDNDHDFDCTITIDKRIAYDCIVDAVTDEQNMSLAEAKAYIRGLEDCGIDIYNEYYEALMNECAEKAENEYRSYCDENEDAWRREYEAERRDLLSSYYDHLL